MSVRVWVYNKLAGAAGLTALVGTRIYWTGKLNQNQVYPAVTYRRISGPREHAVDGPVGYARPRYTVWSYATTMADAEAVAEQVRLALDGASGTDDGTQMHGILLLNESQDYEESLSDSSQQVYVVAQDYELHHAE